MATENTIKPGAVKLKRAEAASEKLIALTLKIDGKTYVRLSTLRAKGRKTVQDILAAALSAYLDQARA